MTDAVPNLDHVTPGSQSDYVLTSDIWQARRNLSEWVRQTARETIQREGFGWVPHPDAPSTYPDLCAAYARSKRTGAPLPVSSEHSTDVVLLEPEDNYSWRYVHDVSHVTLDLSFSLRDEFELALWHLSELERVGYAPDSLEYAFLKADTLGQVIVNATARRFPENQARFALECQQVGFEEGILREIRREPS